MRQSPPSGCRRHEVIGLRILNWSLVGLALASSCLVLFAARPRAAAAAAADSPLRGRILFLRCASCHDAGASPSAKIGPNLRGIVGRQVASVEGYSYSAALKAQSFVWDAAHLDAWLTNPSAVVPGTAMAFAGISEAADRQALIRYLETQ